MKTKNLLLAVYATDDIDLIIEMSNDESLICQIEIDVEDALENGKLPLNCNEGELNERYSV